MRVELSLFQQCTLPCGRRDKVPVIAPEVLTITLEAAELMALAIFKVLSLL